MSVNFADFGEKLGEALGIGSFAGGLLATIIVMFAAFALLGAIKRKAPTTVEALLLGLPVLGFSTALGWCPIWVFTIICLLVAILYANRFSEMK